MNGLSAGRRRHAAGVAFLLAVSLGLAAPFASATSTEPEEDPATPLEVMEDLATTDDVTPDEDAEAPSIDEPIPVDAELAPAEPTGDVNDEELSTSDATPTPEAIAPALPDGPTDNSLVESDERTSEPSPAARSVSPSNETIIPFAAGLRSPTVLYLEDFESGTSGTTSPTSLSSYEGSGGTRYTASNYWLDAGYCNGFVTGADVNLSQTSIDTTYCGRNPGYHPGDYEAVQVKSYALGQLANADNPAKNRALSTNTSGGRPSTDIHSDDSIMFRTDPSTPIILPAKAEGRFIAFSVDAANTYCSNPRPLMQFQYVQNDVTMSLPLGADGYIDPCESTGSTSFNLSANPLFDHVPPEHIAWVTRGAYGTFYSGSFLLTSTDPIDLILRNISDASSEGAGIGNPPANTSGYVEGSDNGNDGAIDNIRIVDVTPVLDKEFLPAEQSVGRTSEMVLTINNREDLGKKEGWEFVDTLPEGLEFANSTVNNECGGSAVVNVANRTLTVKNGVLEEGQASCTIRTTVTSTTVDEYTNGNDNGNFSDKKYIDGPDDAKVKFYAGSVSWNKVDAEGGLLAGSEWELTGPHPATASQPEGGWPVGAVTDCVAESASSCSGLDEDPVAGQFKVSGLPIGTYTLTETVAPIGYQPLTDPVTVTITGDTRDVAFGVDGRIENKKLPVATVTISKRVLDFAGENPQPGVGWEMGAVLDGTIAAGISITTSAPQLTGDDGVVPTPWEISFPLPDSAVDVAVSEVQQPGFGFHSGSCTITPTSGSARSVTLQGVDAVLDSVKPGDTVACEFTNRPIPGSVTWEKIDQNDKPLAGSEWTIISGPGISGDGVIVSDCIAATCPAGTWHDQDPEPGAFKLENLVWGIYTMKETKAPAGYQLNSEERTFTISADSLTATVTGSPFVNVPRDTPTLPLTGGIGRDAFFIGGVGVLLLGFGAVIVAQIRNRRSASLK